MGLGVTKSVNFLNQLSALIFWLKPVAWCAAKKS